MSEKGGLLRRLDCKLISAALQEMGQATLIDLQVLDSTGSTNDQVMARMRESNEVSACVANQQTAGRGRNGATWVSPPDANIYLSVGFVFELSLLSKMGGLSLACGVAMARLFSGLNIKVRLKWPNDIFFEEKKLAGILVETRIMPRKVLVVVGVGVNIQMPEVSANCIDQPWVDLKSIIKKQKMALDRNELVGKILNEITLSVSQFKQTGFESFLKDWERFDMLVGRHVVVKVDAQEYAGTVLGVAEDHGLRVRVKNEEKTFYAADVKLSLS